MLVKDLTLLPEITLLATPDEDFEIGNLFCGDLHSWAVAHLKPGACWCTVMANVNTLAVASLQDIACVVLCHGTEYTPEFVAMASSRGVNLFASNLPEFDAALLISKELEKQ